MTTPTKVSVHNIYKIFGRDPASVMDRVRAGIGKAELLEETGHVIGIRDVSLDIAPGETFVIMGLSGSGKSTLIRHFNRLIEPTAGEILVDGTDIMKLGEAALREFRRSKISMVFQRFALLPHKTVLENVAYGLIVAGMNKAKAHEKAMAQVELVGLSGFERHYPKQLSGGMQQRVGLARALATESEVLLMDEAFSALDPLIRNDMQAQLKDLQARLHKTIVFITHDLDEALRLGDRIAILKDGELRQVGTASDILLRPADDYIERFVRDVNRARVVTFGSIARPVVIFDDVSASEEACKAAIAANGVAIVRQGPSSYQIRQGAGLNSQQEQPFQQGSEAAVCIGQSLTLEEGFEHFARSELPIVVVDGNMHPVGVVTRTDVLEALAPT